MTDIRHRDPILDPPRQKNKTGLLVGVIFATVLWSLLALYLINSRFTLVVPNFTDEKVKVQLEKLPPPPPPPPPPPKAPPPPPKVIQPREVKAPPVNIPQPAPLNLGPPVKKEDHVVTTGPVAPPAPKVEHTAVIANPDWVRLPNGDDLVSCYPPSALDRGTEGHSEMECTVTSKGTLTDCHVVSETPAGAGFGNAELRCASKFRMRPQTVDGRPTEGGKVRIPLKWQVK
jgi:protein TonB